MRRNPWAAALGALFVAAGLGIGGYFLYQAGFQNGLAETASEVVVQTRAFYPVFPFFGFIFLFFLFMFLSRIFFWRTWRRGYGRGSWSDHEGSPMEHHLRDWHEKAHSSEDRRKYRSDSGDTRQE